MQIHFSAAFGMVNHQPSELCSVGIGGSVLYILFSFSVVSEQLWLFNSQVEDSIVGDKFVFHPLNGTEDGLHHP